MLRGQLYKIHLILFFGLAILCSRLDAQVRSGSAFLKMLPGARLQSMAGAHTAVIDDPHAIFANPGTAGFLREWQWAASYTKWIADIYNASFIYGGKIPMPWSRQSRFALGLLYQGMPEFNNNSSTLPPASASDFVGSISVGQPLTFISNNIAFGTNLKYFKSTLAQYSAASFVYDIGLTARTKVFGLGKSLKSAFVLGGALNQNGNDLTFDKVGTPLPKTGRAGLAFYLGTHKGLNMLLSADYVSVKDEKGYVAFGAELMLNRLFALNAGYDLGSDLFKKATFGASIRLDHVGLALGDAFPGRHNAFRLDLATLDESDFFSRTYRGTASHFPTKPEFFKFVTPAVGDTILTPDVVLRWGEAREMDIYDEVSYHVLVDRDSANIAHILSIYESTPEKFSSALLNKLDMNERTSRTFIPANALPGGDYYWAVAAMDKDEQVSFAHGESGPIAHFSMPSPDIEIKDIEFEHSPYITMDDYHGVVRITVQNNGERPVEDVAVRFVDEIDQLDYTLDAIASTSEIVLPERPSHDQELILPLVAPGESEQLEIEWHSALLGKHKITVVADPDEHVLDINRDNNKMEKILHTIPKGMFAAKDSVSALQTSTRLVDMPLITEVTFDANSNVVKKEFTQNGKIEPILSVFAKRLKKNPQMKIQLQGFVDPNSEDTIVSLANERSNAVKKVLVGLGVDGEQIEIVRGEVLPLKTMRSNEQDSKWLLEERRYVKIETSRENSPVLLRPIRHEEVKIDKSDVQFTSDISGVSSFRDGVIHFESGSAKDEQKIMFTDNRTMVPNVRWQPDASGPGSWSDGTTHYYLSLTDSLGRQFRTHKKQLTMREKTDVKRQILSIPLQFGKTDPMAEYYWEEIFNYAKETMADTNMHLRFEGHACAIGSAEVNKKLSAERAKRFDREFKKFLSAKNDDTSQSIANRIDQAVGLGESKPLTMELSTGALLLGDNNSSVGRKLNRRIELVFYKN